MTTPQPSLSHAEILRYSRHLLLPEVGLPGQQKLKAGRVLVVGAGGLGSPISLYLAAAGVGRIGVVDYDVVDVSNLQRQVLYDSSQVGQRKVEMAVQRLRALNPAIQVDGYDEPFTSANALQIAENYDVLVDGTDNFPTRYLINDVCVFQGKPYVYGSIYRFDGQVSVFDARRGPCYRCLFPEPPPPHLVPSCADGGVLGVLPGVIGALQASETLKLLLELGDPLIGRLLLFNALGLSFEDVRLRKHPRCRVCGPKPEVTSLIDYDALCGVPGHAAGAEAVAVITPQELAARLARPEAPLQLIDVREVHEMEISHLPGAACIPLGELPSRLGELDPAAETVLFCKTGVRSRRALDVLAAAGFENVCHLEGGVNAWVRQVDPSQPVY